MRYGVKLTPSYKTWRGKWVWYASLMKLNPETDEWECVRKYEEVKDGYYVAYSDKSTDKLIQKCKDYLAHHGAIEELTQMVDLGEYPCNLPSTSL